jgi:hypothetical protein
MKLDTFGISCNTTRFIIIIIIIINTTTPPRGHHDTAMAQLTMADLEAYPGTYDSDRDVGDVLIGEDAARPVIEASSSGNDTALRSFLSQPQWIKTMLESVHCIYAVLSVRNGVRRVMATPRSHLERALTVAAQNGHAGVVSTLLAFASHQNVNALDEEPARTIITKTIRGGHAAVFKALAAADPNIVNFRLPHGTLPLYEAVRQGKTDVERIRCIPFSGQRSLGATTRLCCLTPHLRKVRA